MNSDPRLAPLLDAHRDDAGGDLEQLLVQLAAPIVERILARAVRTNRGLTQDDADDLASAVQLRLLARLRELRDEQAAAIHDFEKYVATLAYNAVNDHLRQRFPERARHKNRLRHVLRNDPRLARWPYAAGVACGFREWRGMQQVASTAAIAVEPVMRDRDAPADALVAIFRGVGKPLPFEEVVSFTAGLWHVVDPEPVDASHAASANDDVEERFDARRFLAAMWREVEQLPPMQRQALLLNLRESETANAITLVTLTGVASFDDVARALEMTPDELALLWNDLPLDDLRIAARLGLARQQVINLRKSARQRLARRLKR